MPALESLTQFPGEERRGEAGAQVDGVEHLEVGDPGSPGCLLHHDGANHRGRGRGKGREGRGGVGQRPAGTEFQGQSSVNHAGGSENFGTLPQGRGRTRGRPRGPGRGRGTVRGNNSQNVGSSGGPPGNHPVHARGRGAPHGRPRGTGRGIGRGRGLPSDSAFTTSSDSDATAAPPGWSAPEIQPIPRSPHGLRRQRACATPPLQNSPSATNVSGSPVQQLAGGGLRYSPHSALGHHRQRRRITNERYVCHSTLAFML